MLSAVGDVHVWRSRTQLLDEFFSLLWFLLTSCFPVDVSIIWGLFLLSVPSVFRVQHMEFQYHYHTKHCYKIVWVQCAIAGRKKHEEMYKCKLSRKKYFEYYRRKINNGEPFTE